MSIGLITKTDYQLLILLQSKPTISYSEIARIFNISSATAKRKIVELRNKGLYSGKYAQFYPTALGLNKFIVVSFVKSIKQILMLEKALREHPYTIHRSRIYSPKLGIYSEFNFPMENTSFLEEFYDNLKNEKVIDSFTIYESTHIEKTLPLNLNKVSLDTLSWEYDWNTLKESLDKTEKAVIPVPPRNMLKSMKELDFKILSILTVNADYSQREISRMLKRDRTEVWRRFKFLEENIISGYRSKINRQKFNITSNKIIFLRFEDELELWQYFSLLSDEQLRPPFRYRIEILKEKNSMKKIFQIYISLPQNHEAQLFYFIADNTDFESYNIDTVGTHGVRYSFYEPNFDYNDWKWKINRKYVVTDAIRNIVPKKI
ncbi:MAG: winged helix-turn-helix transcriptional regulator [Candidatus Heimdallarchaeaceae archaeon]